MIGLDAYDWRLRLRGESVCVLADLGRKLNETGPTHLRLVTQDMLRAEITVLEDERV